MAAKCRMAFGHFAPDLIRQHANFGPMRDWMAQRLFPELAESSYIGSYDISELRTFFAALHTVSHCVRTLEDEVDRRVGPNNNMGTWTFQLQRPSFIDWLVEVTGLHEDRVDSIVAD